MPKASIRTRAALGAALAIPLAMAPLAPATAAEATRPSADPELSFAIVPEPATGWYRTPVNVIVSARTTEIGDRIIGVHWWSRGPVSANGDAVGEDEIGFTIDVDGVTRITYTATTALGGFNQDEATVRIDTAPPEIRFTDPSPGSGAGSIARVELGSSARLAFTCNDAHSGIDFCGAELPLIATRTLPLETSTLGKKHLVVEAADRAGNRSKATFEYDVVRTVVLANTVTPRTSGTAKVGRKLSATRGSWSGSPTSYSYQWYRGSTKIAKATTSSYRLKSADRGKKIRIKITAKRAGSVSRVAYSKYTTAVRR